MLSRESKEKVDGYKIDYLDIDKHINIVPKLTIDDIEELKGANKKKIFYKSNKFLIHGGKAYASKMAVAA